MTPIKKKVAADTMPQTITDVEMAIARIGRLSGELNANAAALNTHIATLRERASAQAKPIQDEIDRLTKGVQAYCETRRKELTDGKTKTLKFVTGTVSWRKARARVEIDDEESVIAQFKKAGLAMFVRLREEIDKAEILKRPVIWSAPINGLRVVEGAETFVVEPKKG